MLPIRLPQYTMVQLRSISTAETLPLAQAITIRLLPVNNSAPPTSTIVESEREDQSAHYARCCETQLGVARDNRIIKCAKPNAATGNYC